MKDAVEQLSLRMGEPLLAGGAGYALAAAMLVVPLAIVVWRARRDR